MRMLVLGLAAAAAAIVPTHGASACPPLPPGYVPPTDEQRLDDFARRSDIIVYGVVTGTARPGERSRLKILHVYKGNVRKGQTILAQTGFDYPVPACAGMMGPPPPKANGTYGVVALRTDAWGLTFIKAKDVQMMIERGLIRSARAR